MLNFNYYFWITDWHHGPQRRKISTCSLGTHRPPSWQRPIWFGEIINLQNCRKKFVRFRNIFWNKTWHLNWFQNVFSVVSLSRLILPHFEAKGRGCFALMSSTAGKVGVPFSGTYTASKHALHVKNRPYMTSRNFGQFLTPPPQSWRYYQSDRLLPLLPCLRPWRHLWITFLYCDSWTFPFSQYCSVLGQS